MSLYVVLKHKGGGWWVYGSYHELEKAFEAASDEIQWIVTPDPTSTEARVWAGVMNTIVEWGRSELQVKP